MVQSSGHRHQHAAKPPAATSPEEETPAVTETEQVVGNDAPNIAAVKGAEVVEEVEGKDEVAEVAMVVVEEPDHSDDTPPAKSPPPLAPEEKDGKEPRETKTQGKTKVPKKVLHSPEVKSPASRQQI